MKKQKLFYLFGILLVAVMVLSACGPAEPAAEEPAAEEPAAEEPAAEEPAAEEPAAEEPAAEEPAAEEPAYTGPEFKNPDTYVYVTFGEPQTLDPAWTYETAGSSIETNIYDLLLWFERERTDKYVPVLATSWEPNEAGDVWTFNIREGVTFHQGGTLEPHDVAYSLQRAMLQDRAGGPHWMTWEVFFGNYSAIENVGDGSYSTPDEATPAELEAACEALQDVIVADDEAGTVTYTLANPAPWFLAIQANVFAGAVYDQEWMAENGGWDGDCTTWQNYWDPSEEETILFNVGNGTGPYMLDHWTPGEEIVLVRNENYWRADDDPVWEGGPSGIASIERAVYLMVDEFGTRLAMFQAGDADYITVPGAFQSQVEPFYGSVYCFVPDNPTLCPEEQPDGWVQVYSGYQTAAMTATNLNQQIDTEGGNPFLGSGELDGNGIPPDFFQDVHIRRAFSWCMDYDTVIQEAYNGQGTQAQGPIIAGMLGYRDDGYYYHYDLDKCAEEFQASESGVWDTGFYMQITYNTGNEGRRLVAEVLKASLEQVNPKFQVAVVGMPWPVMLNSLRANKLPVTNVGWLEDFHDPHNWMQPYLSSQGAFGSYANIQEPLKSEFDAMVNEAASYTDPEQRRPIYEELQLMAQTEAAYIWLIQPTGRTHLSPWIQGWYFNSAYSSTSFSYLYALAKVGP